MNDIFVDMNLDNNDSLGQVIGDHGNSQGFSPWVYQGYSDTCAIRCQQIILRDFGIDISQEDLMNISSSAGWYSHEGTDYKDVGNILELAGVGCHQTSGNSVLDLVSELSKGHRVIVGVDSGELWAKTFQDSFMEHLEDLYGLSAADHALIVAGVDVNPQDFTDIKVVLTDPGTGSLRVEYPLDQFMDAWQDSNCFMMSTDDPAPYQFDPISCREIPSCFNTDFQFNSFIVDNGYQLSPMSLYTPSSMNYLTTDLFALDYTTGGATLNPSLFGSGIDTDPFSIDEPGGFDGGIDDFDGFDLFG